MSDLSILCNLLSRIYFHVYIHVPSCIPFYIYSTADFKLLVHSAYKW